MLTGTEMVADILNGIYSDIKIGRSSKKYPDYDSERYGTYRSEAKVGRNAPCPCGSGKKYKKCCGGQNAKN